MSLIIKSPTEKDIYSFFTSLSDGVLYNFTLYPHANTKQVTLKLSKTLPKDKTQKIFGAFENGKMVGFGNLRFFPKETMKHVCQFGIVISDSNQGKGYGKMLSTKMIDWAMKNKFKKIWLNVYSDNPKAIGLYKTLGFQIEGIFMYNEYFVDKPRHTISMALFFDCNPFQERKKLWKKEEI